MNTLHNFQNQILKKLMFSEGLKYSQMKPDPEMENNQFQFHLDQLTKNNFVKKNGNKYFLDTKGKHYIKKMDNESGEIVKQPHISVRIACVRKVESLEVTADNKAADKNNENEYLFYKRLKHPYFGCQGFPAGKLEHGEIIKQAAARELLEETNLTADLQLCAVTHYIDLDKNKNVLTDKLMFLFIAQNPKGELVQSAEGEYGWVKRSKVKQKITKPFEDIDVVIKELDIIDSFDGTITFVESVHEVEEKF